MRYFVNLELRVQMWLLVRILAPSVARLSEALSLPAEANRQTRSTSIRILAVESHMPVNKLAVFGLPSVATTTF